MLREPKGIYSYNNFDQDGHIAVFLQTSAVYLGVNDNHVLALSNKPWQTNMAIFSRETKHA